MNAKQIAKQLADSYRTKIIKAKENEESNKLWNAKNEKKWFNKIAELVEVFKDDFKISTPANPRRGLKEWDIINKQKLVLVTIRLDYHYYKGYSDPDGNGWINEHTDLAVQIFKGNPANISSSYYTSYFDNLETQFIEVLGTIMSEYY